MAFLTQGALSEYAAGQFGEGARAGTNHVAGSARDGKGEQAGARSRGWTTNFS